MMLTHWKKGLLFIFTVILILYFQRSNDFLLFFENKNFPIEHMIDFKSCLIQPDRITCGPTSATMVLLFFQKKCEIEEIKNLTKTVWFNYDGKPVGMTSPELIATAFAEYGITSNVKKANLNFLKYQISKNNPCIVLIRSGEYKWHYVVVIGYNQKEIFIADPGRGYISFMQTQNFTNSWNWSCDTNGNACKSYTSMLLEFINVCPNTIIYSEM